MKIAPIKFPDGLLDFNNWLGIYSRINAKKKNNPTSKQIIPNINLILIDFMD